MLEFYLGLFIATLGVFAFWTFSDPLVMQAARWRFGRDKTNPLVIKVHKSGKVILKCQKANDVVWFGKDSEGHHKKVTIGKRYHYTPNASPVHFCVEGNPTNINVTKEYSGSRDDETLRSLLGLGIIYNKAKEAMYDLEKPPFDKRIIAIVLVGALAVVLYIFYGDMAGVLSSTATTTAAAASMPA